MLHRACRGWQGFQSLAGVGEPWLARHLQHADVDQRLRKLTHSSAWKNGRATATAIDTTCTAESNPSMKTPEETYPSLQSFIASLARSKLG